MPKKSENPCHVFNLCNRASELENFEYVFFLSLLGGFWHQFETSFGQPEIVFLHD